MMPIDAVAGVTTLSVDAGTTVIKAVLFDASGRELLVTRRPTRILSPRPGWSEQDMTEVAEAVFACIAEAVASSPQPIGRVAVTAQGDGAWMLDRRGAPARAAVLWNDARATAIVDRWDRDGVLERAFRINGSLGNLGLPHAILRWFLDNDAGALSEVSEVTTCGSFLFFALTGRRGLHPTDASAPWVDAHTGEYSDDLFDLFDLAAVRDLIPPILRDDQQTAAITEEVAARTGLPAGTSVTLAPYDVVATALGGGSVSAGSAFCILGTTLCTGVVTSRADTGGPAGGLTLLGDDGLIIRAFPTLAGTGVIEWARGVLAVDDAEAVVALAAQAPPGASGVRVWPYLSPAGERAPFLDPDSRGVIAGLSFESSRADIARAVVEGLAHVIRECLAAVAVQPRELIVSGGGASSDLWCRAIADVTGIPTVRIDGSQIGAKGAAMCAAVAAGDFDDLRAAARTWVVPAQRFDPDAALRALFDERHADFLATRDALAPRWHAWAGERAEP